MEIKDFHLVVKLDSSLEFMSFTSLGFDQPGRDLFDGLLALRKAREAEPSRRF